MSAVNAAQIEVLDGRRVDALSALLDVFAEAFDDAEHYSSRRPARDYLARLIDSGWFIAVVAVVDGRVVGGIAAYVLHKFEQQRSEVYLYDLAVLEAFRRRGIATALINALKAEAIARGACAIYVQADTGPEDAAAIALYSKLGVGAEVLHFDLALERG